MCQQVLKALGFGQIDGREVHSLPGIPSTFPAFAEFDMGKYFNEAEGTPAFVEYLQVGRCLGTGGGSAQLTALLRGAFTDVLQRHNMLMAPTS